jgi:hypothetical protein
MEHEPGALAVQPARNGSPDAPGSAGNQNDFSGKDRLGSSHGQAPFGSAIGQRVTVFD